MKTFAVGLGFTSALAALGMLAGLPAKGLGDPTGSGQPASLGKMTAFWWHRPVVDRWMKGRLGFQKIPDYLCDPSLSFPYRRKPQPEEVPFADHLTVVRVLGVERAVQPRKVKVGVIVNAFHEMFLPIGRPGMAGFKASRPAGPIAEFTTWQPYPDKTGPETEPYTVLNMDRTILLSPAFPKP